MKASYYKPSGKFSAVFFLYFVLFVLIGIPVLSMAYIYLNHFLPYIYFCIIMTFFCGVALGRLIVIVAKLGKVRNQFMVAFMTFVAACILKYVQWCVYVPLTMSEVYGISMTIGERLSASVSYFVHPGWLLEWVLIINEYGTWGLNDSSAVTGIMLLVVWAFEYIFITGSAIVTAWVSPDFPFSEEAGRWYTEIKERKEIDIPANISGMKAELENGVYEEFVRFSLAGRTNAQHCLSLTFYKPPQGSNTEPYYMTVMQPYEISKGRKSNSRIISLIAIDEKSVNAINNSGKEFNEGL